MGRTVTETHTTGVRGDSGPEVAQLVASRVLDVPDFPKPGVMFKDLMPLFADGAAFREVIDGIIAVPRAGLLRRRGRHRGARVRARRRRSRYATGVGVVPVRKAGKLPRATHAASYALEYGEATLEVHQDAFIAGHRVLVVDDVLATGGTAEATLDLVERAGGTSPASPSCWSWDSWTDGSGSPRVRSMPC